MSWRSRAASTTCRTGRVDFLGRYPLRHVLLKVVLNGTWKAEKKLKQALEPHFWTESEVGRGFLDGEAVAAHVLPEQLASEHDSAARADHRHRPT